MARVKCRVRFICFSVFSIFRNSLKFNFVFWSCELFTWFKILIRFTQRNQAFILIPSTLIFPSPITKSDCCIRCSASYFFHLVCPENQSLIVFKDLNHSFPQLPSAPYCRHVTVPHRCPLGSAVTSHVTTNNLIYTILCFSKCVFGIGPRNEIVGADGNCFRNFPRHRQIPLRGDCVLFHSCLVIPHFCSLIDCVAKPVAFPIWWVRSDVSEKFYLHHYYCEWDRKAFLTFKGNLCLFFRKLYNSFVHFPIGQLIFFLIFRNSVYITLISPLFMK